MKTAIFAVLFIAAYVCDSEVDGLFDSVMNQLGNFGSGNQQQVHQQQQVGQQQQQNGLNLPEIRVTSKKELSLLIQSDKVVNMMDEGVLNNLASGLQQGTQAPPNCELKKIKFFFEFLSFGSKGRRLDFRQCLKKHLDYVKLLLNSPAMQQIRNQGGQTRARPMIINLDMHESRKSKQMVKAFAEWIKIPTNASAADVILFEVANSKHPKHEQKNIEKCRKYVDQYLKGARDKKCMIRRLLKKLMFWKKAGKLLSKLKL